ncbi:MAG TPA: sulfite exporter TauE/SafE family protein [Polyangia bacterium]
MFTDQRRVFAIHEETWNAGFLFCERRAAADGTAVEDEGRTMDLLSLTPALGLDAWSATAGLVAGIASSAHCAVMCGPLACAAVSPSAESTRLIRLGRPQPRRWQVPLAYHAARIAAYGAVGTALGAAGEGARQTFAGITPALPWIMAGALVASAAGVGKQIPVPAVLKRLAAPIVRKSANFAPGARAAAIGAATPLLPCGSLYGLFVAAMAAASAVSGGVLMAAFAVGASPALALVQAHAPLLNRYPRASLWVRRLVPLLAAAALVWRAAQLGDGSAAPTCH